jgi:hypothetical protein
MKSDNKQIQIILDALILYRKDGTIPEFCKEEDDIVEVCLRRIEIIRDL